MKSLLSDGTWEENQVVAQALILSNGTCDFINSLIQNDKFILTIYFFIFIDFHFAKT